MKLDANKVEPTRLAPMTVAPKKTSSTPPPAVGFPPGRVIGRYVVVRPLGRGGMGAVMLAFDTQLGRSVALKLMLTHVESEEARLRFVREAQAMARLSHPNVVGIYDVGVHEGNVFLAMEYVDGVLLSAWLKETHSIRELVAVMKQAAEGLRAAHEAGIVHRDFKPTNVLVAKDGRVCVFDFGIARTEGIDEPTVANPSPASERRPVAFPMGFDGALRLAEQARALARETNVARAETLADVRVGSLVEAHYDYPRALQTETHAYLAAEAIGQDSLGAAAALEIAFLDGQRMHHTAAAQQWLALERAKIARMRWAPSLEVEALKVEAEVEPDLHRSLDLNAPAIEAATSAYGDTSVAV